ncbi:Hypothetical predicted protein, partial [Marmota monax]
GTTEVIRSLDLTITAWSTEATTNNRSYFPPICDGNNLIQTVSIFIVCLFGLVGNASVIWFLGFQMCRNPFYNYLLNLAVADFLFLCLHTIATLLNVIEIFLPINIPRYGILETLATFSYLVDMNMISAINTEHCLSVLWPIWYRCHRPRRTSAVICDLLWALSMFLSIPISVVCINFNILDDICDEVEFTITVWMNLLFVVLLVSSLALL